MRVRRIVPWGAAALAVAVGLLWPAMTYDAAPGTPTRDSVRFTDYRADLVVDADGGMSAVETITATFPFPRHGLVREFEVDDPYAPHTRRIPTDVTAEIDGRSAEVETSWQDEGTFVARIGDPHHELPIGSHVVTIRHHVNGVLDPGDTGAEFDAASSTGASRDTPSVFLRQVVPPWNNEIDRATISLTLPGTVPGAGCTVGTGDRSRPCAGLAVDDRTVRVEATGLGSRAPVTLRAGTDAATPARVFLPWTPRFDGVFGRTFAGGVWPVALTVLAVLTVGLWLRAIRGGPLAAPVQNAPPEGLGPAQWDFVRTLRVNPQALTATLLHLAEQKLVTLTEVNESRWTVEGIADQDAWDRTDAVSRRAGALMELTRPGDVLNANGTPAAGRRLGRARDDLDGAVRKWAERERLVVPDRRLDVIGLRWVGVLAGVVSVAGVTPWTGLPTAWAAPFMATCLMSVPAWRRPAGLRRTAAGTDLAVKVRGFHRLLATGPSEARFDFSGRSGVFTSYLPYALIAGIADRWAATFGRVTGTQAPELPWTRIQSSSSAYDSAGLAGFSSAVTTSLISHAPPTSVGAYGGVGHGVGADGGGGGSGGGGDGGGSGSW